MANELRRANDRSPRRTERRVRSDDDGRPTTRTRLAVGRRTTVARTTERLKPVCRWLHRSAGLIGIRLAYSQIDCSSSSSKRVSAASIARGPLGARGVWPSIHTRRIIFVNAGSWLPKCAGACFNRTLETHLHPLSSSRMSETYPPFLICR